MPLFVTTTQKEPTMTETDICALVILPPRDENGVKIHAIVRAAREGGNNA